MHVEQVVEPHEAVHHPGRLLGALRPVDDVAQRARDERRRVVAACSLQQRVQLETHLAATEGIQLGHHHTRRSEEHTSELQYLMRISYAVFCFEKKKTKTATTD